MPGDAFDLPHPGAPAGRFTAGGGVCVSWPVTRLNHLLQSGGRPVGILAYHTVAGETRWSARPLQQCADEAWVPAYLEAVAAAEAAAGRTDALVASD